MIGFTLQQEPDRFGERCRDRGRAWLAEHPDYDRPYDYWSEFEPDLRSAFNHLCGWCAMFVMRGQIDHFVPVATLKANGQDNLAYEWSNFRYIEGWINQKKLDAVVLDPFEVRDGWFEIDLPSLQLRKTAQLPDHLQDLADFTLLRLGLRNHEVVLRYRRAWFEKYQAGQLTLEGLRDFAPLIAAAIERDLANGIDWQVSAS